MAKHEKKNKCRLPLTSVMGTRDFYPEELSLRNDMFETWRKISRLHGAQEYEAPVVESKVWFTTKRGNDDVLKEMFVLHNEEWVLRPELTPSMCRMVLQKYRTEMLPCKWFSIAQCWRMETATSLRKREHFQWNVDFIGMQNKMQSESELLILVVSCLREFGLTPKDIVIKYSHRQLVTCLLSKMITPLDTPLDSTVQDAIRLLDKRNKLNPSEFDKQLATFVSESEQRQALMRILSSLTLEDVEKECKTFFQKKQSSTNLEESKEEQENSLPDEVRTSLAELQSCFKVLVQLGLSDWFQLDLFIIRGLEYYTGIVFEGFEAPWLPERRAVLGGGRYDKLFSVFDGRKSIPTVGFGMGDVVLGELLKEKKLLTQRKECKYLVVAFDETLFPDALQVAQKIRQEVRDKSSSDVKKSVDTLVSHSKKLGSFLGFADRRGFEHVLILFPTEWTSQQKIVWIQMGKSRTERQTTLSLEEFLLSIAK
jgi:histidyl-tRNA synthetase